MWVGIGVNLVVLFERQRLLLSLLATIGEPMWHTDFQKIRNSRDRIFFNRVIVLIRPPGFLQLPRAGFGRSGKFVMIDR